jgi:20S proteasome alpha/beta subunit
MSTVIGIECAGGAAVAGDRLAVDGDRVVSRSVERVFDYADLGVGDIGVAVVGAEEADRGAVAAFDRDFEAELREYGHDHDRASRDAVLRMAADVAAGTGAAGVVAARADDGVGRLATVYPDGSATEDPVAALGSGADLALGGLETADRDVDVEAAARLARETFESVAERDPGTGADADVWTLASAGE